MLLPHIEIIAVYQKQALGLVLDIHCFELYLYLYEVHTKLY